MRVSCFRPGPPLTCHVMGVTGGLEGHGGFCPELLVLKRT